MCLNTGDVDFGYLLKATSASFSTVKLPFSPLGEVLYGEIYKYPTQIP